MTKFFQIAALSISTSLFIHTPIAAANNCTFIPEKSPVIKTCKEDGVLEIAGDSFSDRYELKTYQQKLSNTLSRWLSQRGISKDRYCGKSVELFLSVPEINPSMYALRVQVEFDEGPLLFTLPGNENMWQDSEVEGKVFLKGDYYPASYGYKAGSLLAKINENFNLAELKSYLNTFGADTGSHVSNGWISISTPIFEEVRVLDEIVSSSLFEKYFIKATLNSSYEWMSYKGSIDNFLFKCDR